MRCEKIAKSVRSENIRDSQLGRLKAMRGRMARFLDEIAKYYYGDTPFWSPSYFVATTGSVSLEKVKEYVNSQRTEEHHNKYKK